MAMYDYVYLKVCMAIYGYAWLYMVMYICMCTDRRSKVFHLPMTGQTIHLSALEHSLGSLMET